LLTQSCSAHSVEAPQTDLSAHAIAPPAHAPPPEDEVVVVVEPPTPVVLVELPSAKSFNPRISPHPNSVPPPRLHSTSARATLIGRLIFFKFIFAGFPMWTFSRMHLQGKLKNRKLVKFCRQNRSEVDD